MCVCVLAVEGRAGAMETGGGCWDGTAGRPPYGCLPAGCLLINTPLSSTSSSSSPLRLPTTPEPPGLRQAELGGRQPGLG